LKKIFDLSNVPNFAICKILDLVGICCSIEGILEEDFMGLIDLKLVLRSYKNDPEIQINLILLIGRIIGNPNLISFISNEEINFVIENLIYQTGDLNQSAFCAIIYAFNDKSDESTMNLLLGLIQNHLENENLFNFIIKKATIRPIAYQVLLTMLSHQFIFRIALNSSNILTVLLNRSNDLSSEGLKWKFTILENIFKRDDLIVLLNEQTKQEIKKYLSSGIFYNDNHNELKYETVQ
jgi:hypothetical protein